MGSTNNTSQLSAKDIFFQALDKPSAERSAFLDQACVGQSPLRQQVEVLLVNHFRADSFMDEPAINADTVLSEVTISEGPGCRIGRYKLLQKIGEGGMGVVYMAEQEEPVRRRVAFKIIKLGMDTKQVVARFEAERQALALMDHPNIARVLDGGATDTGRPYFVMELVQGVPITEFCDKNKLSARERIELFIPVCQAIQSAHQKGIIHRDIKPSNILVTLNGGAPVPKVIDFGVAKATNQKLTEKTLFTNYATMIGTPAYMSPEQAEMSSLDVDTRTDIYSLGVLLYELLTGTTPFPEERLRSVGYGEMQRIIAEEEPVRPSTRLSTMKDEQRGVVVPNRGVSGLALADVFSSDLDWIVMKCLEKDRARRYETANGLAIDIQRHLDNEPIIARPPSQLYKIQKFARRNKVACLAAVTVGAALILGISLATIGFFQARWQRNQARKAQDIASAAQAQAQANARIAREEELYARRRAYVANMNVVQQAWDEGHLGRAQALLQSQIPKPGEPDLRGFEWRYLWALCKDQSRAAYTNFDDGISGLALSPGGQFIAVATGHLVKFLDLSLKRQLAELHDDSTNQIGCLSFLPISTNILATAGPSGSIRFWDFNTKEITTFADGLPSVNAITFSPDGKKLAAAALHHLIVWDVAFRRILWSTNLSPSPPGAIAFSPDGKILVSGGGARNGNARVWDAENGNQLQPFPLLHSGWMNQIVFSPDGKTLATGAADDKLILWDFERRQPKGPPLRHGGNTIVFSPDGQLIASIGFDLIGHVWEVTSQRLVNLLRAPNPVWGLAFTPDSKGIVTGGDIQTVRLWDAMGAPDKNAMQSEDWVHQLAFSPDGKTLVSVDALDFAIVWDVESRQAITRLAGGGWIGGGAIFSPKGKLLVTSSYSGKLMLWNAKTFQPLRVLTNDFGGSSLTFSPDGKVLGVATGYVTGRPTQRRTLFFWDLDAFKLIERLADAQAATEATAVSFSHDGRILAVGYWDGMVRLWDWATGAKRGEFQEYWSQVNALSFSSDDTLLASGGNGDEQVLVCTVAPLRIQARFGGHVGGVRSVAFAPHGDTLAVGGNDGNIRLWRSVTDEPALILKEHTGAVTSITFTEKGDFLASCGADAAVRVWPAPLLSEIDSEIKAGRAEKH
jgi:WD40 repeat protein/serine/threonine protein kinase